MPIRIRFAALAIPALAACGGGGSTDIEATLRFADRSDLEISRLVNAASGAEGFSAISQAESYADPFGDTDPCPARAMSDDTGTITGGCTTVDGVTIEGSIEIANPLDWCLEVDADGYCATEYEGDFTDDSVYTFHAFAVVQSGYRMAYDGFVIRAGNFSHYDMDVTTEQLGVAVRSDIYASGGGSSASVSGSGIELIGVGGAKVSGSMHLDDEMVRGDFTLTGADTVKVTIADNCVSWRIEGTDRMSPTLCGAQ